MKTKISKTLKRIIGEKVHQKVSLRPGTLPMNANEFYFKFRKYRFIGHNWRFYVSLIFFVLMIVFLLLALFYKNSGFHLVMGVSEAIALFLFFASQNIGDGRLVVNYNRSYSTSFIEVESVEVDWIKKKFAIAEDEFITLAENYASVLDLYESSSPKATLKTLLDIFSVPNLLSIGGVIIGVFVAVQPALAARIWNGIVSNAATWSILGVFFSILVFVALFASKQIYTFIARIYLSKFLATHLSPTTIRELICVLCRNACTK